MATLRLLCARRGFTIVEMVVVLLILAVATAVTVPALRAPAREPDPLTAAEQRIDALFRLARDSAERSGMRVLVTIDSATGGVWLLAGSDPSPVGTSAATRATGASLELPPAVRLELPAARARFEFVPGAPAFGDTLVLRAGSAQRIITLHPWTGDAVAH